MCIQIVKRAHFNTWVPANESVDDCKMIASVKYLGGGGGVLASEI